MVISDSAPTLWQALAHPTRRQIIQLLQDKPRTTSELCRFFAVSRFAIMKHLKVLEQAELVHGQRTGRQRWNTLNPEMAGQLPELLPLAPAGTDETDADAARPVLHLTHTAHLPASPGRVYDALTRQINEWWVPVYPDAHSITLEAQPGGRLVEQFATPEAGAGAPAGALLALVTYLRPDEELRLSGPLDLTVEASLHTVGVRLHPAGEGTTLQLTHHIAGEIDSGMAAHYARFWQERLDQRLHAFLEKG